MSEDNVEIAQRVYDAFNRRDLDAMLACIDPDVQFAVRLIEMQGSPDSRGHDGMREWWRGLLAVFPDIKIELLDVRDLGDSAIATLRIRGHGVDSGVPFDERMWQATKFRDGKVTWWQTVGSEAEAVEALEAAGLSE
jgi:ketosteroid isomerase-like protein